jgi:uncharacterized protein YjbJ (UPF0337 family)
METGKAEGLANEIAGKVENAAGGLIGDSSTQLAGKTRELSSKAQQLCADTTTMLRDATAEKPLTTVALVGLAAFVAGAIWRGGASETRGRRYR